MIRRRSSLYVLLSTAVFASLFCCAGPSKEVWKENGIPVGRVLKYKTDYGKEYRYVDNKGILRQKEKRSRTGELIPGASVVKYEYNDQGYLAQEKYYDGSGKMRICPAGYASRKYSYSTDSTGLRTEEHVYLDIDGKATRTKNGFAFVKFVFDKDGKEVQEVILEDESKHPAKGQWDGVGGVACAKYCNLEAVGKVRCGVYYDAARGIIQRKVLTGVTHHQTRSDTYNYNYFYHYGY
jgi:hypothetical protein